MAHIPGGTILNVLRADEGMNTWLIVLIDLLSIGALSLQSHDVRRFLISIAFWFVRGPLLGYMGRHL